MSWLIFFDPRSKKSKPLLNRISVHGKHIKQIKDYLFYHATHKLTGILLCAHSKHTMSNMNTSDHFSRSNIIIYLLTAIFSILLSTYSVIFNDVINKDGTLYIYTAEAFLEGGFSNAMTVFSWPFFSMLIAWFQSLTGTSFEISAYSVNAILLILLSVTCLRIYEEISEPNIPLWIPALLILALPIVNDYRIYVIRGHGFWAFILLALFFFIRYSKQPSFRTALLWQCFAIIATLFRIEGVAFLALAPFYFLLQDKNIKAFTRHFVRLNSVLIPIAITALIALISYIASSSNISNDLTLRLSYMLPSSMISALTNKASQLVEIMPRLSSTESTLFVISGLIALICYKIVKNINLIYLAIWFIGRRRQWIHLTQESNIVLFFAFISVLPLIALAGNQFFMSSRYTVLPVILFSLIAYQYVDTLFHRLVENRRYIAMSALAALAIIFFLDGIIHTGANKWDMVTASKWVQQNIDPKSRIACNEGRLYFYTNRTCDRKIKLERRGIPAYEKLIHRGKYDHLLLWIDHKDKGIRNYLNTNKQLTLIKSFPNKKQDEVRVYKIQPK